jgi:hypothetical protein
MSVERYLYKGYVIVIETDEDPMNPREEFDNAGKMICCHSRYNLGDEQFKSHEELLNHMGEQCKDWEALLARQEKRAEKSTIGYQNTAYWDQFSKERTEEQLELIEKSLIVLPLFLYDHSGITMNTSGFSCGWDSGQVGYIYITRKKAVEEWGKKVCTKKVVERATKYLEGEVENYDQFLTGEVYGYRVLTPLNPGDIEEGDDPNSEEFDELREETDSCWGFYGYEQTKEDSEMVKEAKSHVDWHIEKQKKVVSSPVLIPSDALIVEAGLEKAKEQHDSQTS